jgi:hypothetical protein
VPSRPKNITPVLQFLVVCRAIVPDSDGQISFQGIFDSVGLPPLGDDTGIEFKFAVAAQFRGGTGPHRFWLIIQHPSGEEITTPESTFWLASKQAAHRVDLRLNTMIGNKEIGTIRLTAILDGRPVMEVPIAVNAPGR